MIKFALRGLMLRKMRTVLTAVGIVLGIGLISGSLMVTESMATAFDDLNAKIYEGTDASITGHRAVEVSDESEGGDPPFSESVAEAVHALPEVEQISASVFNEQTRIVGRDGEVVDTGFAPALGVSIDRSYGAGLVKLAEGSWPGPGEVMIDAETAEDQGFDVGQTIGVLGRDGVRQMTLSGLATMTVSFGGATLAGFDLPTAQDMFGKAGQLDEIYVVASEGVTSEQLVAAIERVLPETAQVLTAEDQAEASAEEVQEFVGFLRIFLNVFGGIALFVGSFVIANALSITIAQRTREFATLRTLGAARRQILRAVVVEALMIGFLASLAGVALGLLLGKGLFTLFDLIGITLPTSGLSLTPKVVIVGLLVGTLVTLVASLRPAIKATRVPPIAAVREGAVLATVRRPRLRTGGAVVVSLLGVAGIALGLFGTDLSTSAVLTLMLGGAVLVFVGVSLFASTLVRPIAAAANPVATWSVFAYQVLTFPFALAKHGVAHLLKRRPEFPSVMPDRVAVRLGGENSGRDTQRTAATAAALMIGLALVALVATLATSIIKPFERAVDEIFRADYAISAQDGFTPIPLAVGDAAASTAGVVAATAVRSGDAEAFDDAVWLTAVEPEAGEVLSLDWEEGSQAVFGELGTDGAFVDDGYAEEHDLSLGSPVELTTLRGDKVALTVKGIFKPPPGGSPFGNLTIGTVGFDAHFDQPLDVNTYLKMSGGVTAANTAALEQSLKPFPNAKVMDREEFKESLTGFLKSILNVLYVLLALSVLVSLFGIINTLVLSVFERTREIGMLRAVGMTRRQTRRMIRHESVITALIGAALGIPLGVGLGALVVSRVDWMSFVLPGGQLVVFAVVAVLAGIFAAVFPARRAARLDPLEALRYE